MKKNLLVATLVVLVPSFAMAHVSVRPRESKPGAEEQYTVRVPTEGAVATTHVVLEIPADVTVLEVLPAEGATFEASKQGDRISSITWRKAIPPKALAEFAFRARNPSTTSVTAIAINHGIIVRYSCRTISQNKYGVSARRAAVSRLGRCFTYTRKPWPR